MHLHFKAFRDVAFHLYFYYLLKISYYNGILNILEFTTIIKKNIFIPHYPIDFYNPFTVAYIS